MTQSWTSVRFRLWSVLLASVAIGFVAPLAGTHAQAAEQHTPPVQSWSWEGWFGTFDRAATQRGLKVYLEVCSACHGIERIAWRNLESIGLSPDEVRALAAEYEVTDGPDDEGEFFDRPAIPSDRLVSPFPNAEAARAANGGAFPPDLSVIIKARAHGEGSIPVNFGKMLLGRDSASGADYIYGLLMGYSDPPEDVVLLPGLSYNTWFPGNQIGMASPLFEDLVEYDDGTPATTDRLARDVTTFLAWASEPELEDRRRMGIKVMLFLLVMLVLVMLVKRRIWQKVDH